MGLQSIFILLCLHISHTSTKSLLGIHPLDEKYYEAEVIKCKDGSKSFTRDRLNDDYCDCSDGTDEPGTSACPAGKFYCKNVGSAPKFIYSSHVNDYICDCCDGSDEYDGVAICPNTCVMGGNIAYQTITYHSNAQKKRAKVNAEDSAQKLGGLKIAIIIQAAFTVPVVGFLLCRRLGRGQRKSIR